jgi:hypothetical protein
MTKKTKILTAAAICAAMALACGGSGKTVHLNFNTVPDNERCNYMKDVCREAERFEAQFDRMSKEEKQDARTVLNSYIQQCADAQEMCKATIDE